jgi:hypothetical protein
MIWTQYEWYKNNGKRVFKKKQKNMKIITFYVELLSKSTRNEVEGS